MGGAGCNMDLFCVRSADSRRNSAGEAPGGITAVSWLLCLGIMNNEARSEVANERSESKSLVLTATGNRETVVFKDLNCESPAF